MEIVDLDKIKTILSTNKEIFQHGNTDVSLFQEYFSLRYKRYQERFIVESRFLWQTYQKQSKIRILLVQMEDGDIVYCYVKNVTIYPAIYLILMGKPLSKSNNRKNEEKVLYELCKYNHVKGFEGISEEINVDKELFVINPPHYKEYYINIPERFNTYLNKSAWKSKYSINMIKGDENFVFREFEHWDYEKNKKLVEDWKLTQKENKVKFETKSYLDILNWAYNNEVQDRYLIYNLFYKDNLIGCLMYLVLKVSDIKISYQEHNINLSKLLEIDNTLNLSNGYYSNIGNIMFYLTTEDLLKKGVKYSYCQGVNFWKEKKCGEYKRRLNDRTIEFSKIFYK